MDQDFINNFEFTQLATNERWGNKYTIDLTNFLKCDIINLQNILKTIETKRSTFQLEFQKFPLEEQARLIKVIDFLVPKEQITTLESLVQYFATYAIQKKKTHLYKTDSILNFIVHLYYSNIDDAESLYNWEPSSD